jgi:hypothetical protein
MKAFQLVCVAVCLAISASAFAQKTGADPLTGTCVELKWDGKNLTGTVNPGPNAVDLKKATFDPLKGAVHFEADTKNRRGNPIHYVIDGKVEKDVMTGTWNHDDRKGDFKITKK